jgi:hypothetical protein
MPVILVMKSHYVKAFMQDHPGVHA